jgi:hypothetical protein
MDFFGHPNAHFFAFDKYYCIVVEMKKKGGILFIETLLVNLSTLKDLHQNHQYPICDGFFNSIMYVVPTQLWTGCL